MLLRTFRRTRPGQGTPAWIDAASFDITQHVVLAPADRPLTGENDFLMVRPSLTDSIGAHPATLAARHCPPSSPTDDRQVAPVEVGTYVSIGNGQVGHRRDEPTELGPGGLSWRDDFCSTASAFSAI